MGAAMESFLFQGKVRPLNGLRSAAKGMVWRDWNEMHVHYDGSLLGEQWYWGIYMVWIEGLFQELTWRKVDALGMKEIEMRVCGDRARSPFDMYGLSYWNHTHGRVFG